MHMADAMLSPAVGGAMYVLSGIACRLFNKEIKKRRRIKKENTNNGSNGSICFSEHK